MTDVTLLLSQALGYLIILGSFIVKVPQIYKIWASGSGEGLVLDMFQQELIGYTIVASYSYMSGFPVSSYGENFSIAVQNIIILVLIEKTKMKPNYGPTIKFVGLLVGGAAVLCSGFIPSQAMQFLFMGSIFIFSYSKIPQILANFKTKSCGQLAFITFALNFAGSAARVFTTLSQISDPVVLLGSIAATVLNGTLVAQILMYPSTAPTTNKGKKSQ